MILEVTNVVETTQAEEASAGVAVFTGSRRFPDGSSPMQAVVIFMVAERNAPFVRAVMKPDAVFALFTWEAESFLDEFMDELCQTVVCRPYQVGVNQT